MDREHVERLRQINLGREHTDEAKQKISEKNCGEKNGMYGKKHTEEALKKISERSTGEKHPGAKLTDEDVLLIREYFDNKTHNQREMSRMFGVSYSTIRGITHRVSWTHL